jgi:Outer membrane protein
MKKIYIYLLTCLVWTAQAQNNITEIVESIKQNNPTLNALREKVEADKIGNKTGINLANPEVEVGYLWGNPSAIGSRKDLNVTQSFDFPTAYRYKSQLSKSQNRQVDIAYMEQENMILKQARELCVELVYRNRMNTELTKRYHHTKELLESYSKLFEKGEVNIIEYNKVKLDFLKAEKVLEINKVEKSTYEAELKRLNGKQFVNTDITEYEDYLLPSDFDTWLAMVKEKKPALLYMRQDIEISRKQEQLTKAMNLPKFTAGYTSERIPGETFQGVSVGISIPLWENRNTLKHRKAQTIALQTIQADTEQQYAVSMRSLYEKTRKLSILLNDYKEVLASSNSEELLKKAFDKGQLSLVNYLLELSSFYDATDQYFETEREYQLFVVELQSQE